ncbi:MAG: heavy metal translocating P-type ATPase, partial [Sutterella sp.]
VGSTTTDQANVTGESLPVDKGPGDNVWSGTVNLTSTVDVTVTAAEADSLTARIIEAVENAQAAKSPVQRFVDKFAAIYTPIVFVVAIAAAIIPPFIWGDWMGWLYKAFCLLVIACPCALVISTPVTIASALGTATRCGLLIKGGLYLEQARQLKYVALDKTGTLTRGEPMVVEAQTLDTVTFDKALEIAASLAKMNKHPLSEAIVRFAHEKGIQVHEVSDFTALPGQGVRGHVHGNTYSLLKPSAVPNEDVQRLTEGFQKQGMSSVVLTDILGAQMIFGFADEMKANIQNDITQLKSVGLTPVLLTGDNREAAEHLAASVGITDVRANLLPEDKLNAIESFQKEGVTAMVGDGINDAPALARSDIGVAMGIRGTDSAIEAAHVAVMDDNIGSIATLVRLSKITHAVLVQNIAFALIIKLVFVLMALAGVATMWMAVFADTGAGLIVVANGMRMLRMKPRLDAQAAAAVKA